MQVRLRCGTAAVRCVNFLLAPTVCTIICGDREQTGRTQRVDIDHKG